MVTADWSCVSVACVPDDTTTPPSRYDATPDGRILYQFGASDESLYFFCSVVNPRDEWGQNPTWTKMLVTYSNPNVDGYINVTLYEKNKDTGAVSVPAAAFFHSGTTVPVRQDGVPMRAGFAGFHFEQYAYYVHIELHRDKKIGNPVFHIVTLRS